MIIISKYILPFLLIFPLIGFSQIYDSTLQSSSASEGYIFQLDSFISVTFPWEDDIYEMDSVVKGKKSHFIYSDYGLTSFLVIKTVFEEKIEDSPFSHLPANKEELEEIYYNVAKGHTEANPYQLISQETIDLSGFSGVILKYGDHSEQQIYEVKIILIENYIYICLSVSI